MRHIRLGYLLILIAALALVVPAAGVDAQSKGTIAAGPHVLWESVNGQKPQAKVHTYSSANECLAEMDNYDRRMQQTLKMAGGRFVLGGQVITALSYVCLPLGTDP